MHIAFIGVLVVILLLKQKALIVPCVYGKGSLRELLEVLGKAGFGFGLGTAAEQSLGGRVCK